MSQASDLALPLAYGVAVMVVAGLTRQARVAGGRRAVLGRAAGKHPPHRMSGTVSLAPIGPARARRRTTSGRGVGVRLLPNLSPAGVGIGWPSPPAGLVSAMSAAMIEVSPTAVWTAWLSVALVVPVIVVATVGIGAGLLAFGVAVAVPLLVLRARRGEADRRMEEAVPAAMEAVARSLRSGASMRQAISEAAPVVGGPLGSELAAVSGAAARGLSLVAALDQMAAGCRLPGPRLAAAALCLGLETGGPQARAADGVAATLRERQGVAAELRALSSQARISALVIGLAPLGFGAFAMVTDPRTAGFVFRTNLGLLLLGCGLALDAAGWLWMRRLCGAP